MYQARDDPFHLCSKIPKPVVIPYHFLRSFALSPAFMESSDDKKQSTLKVVGRVAADEESLSGFIGRIDMLIGQLLKRYIDVIVLARVSGAS